MYRIYARLEALGFDPELVGEFNQETYGLEDLETQWNNVVDVPELLTDDGTCHCIAALTLNLILCSMGAHQAYAFDGSFVALFHSQRRDRRRRLPLAIGRL